MSQLIHSELSSGQHVYYSPVEKESDRGFSMNKRLFLMLENHFICYLSTPVPPTPLTHAAISQLAKLVVPLKQLVKISSRGEKRQLGVDFWLMEKGKRVEKRWVMRMENEKLLEEWQRLFDQYSNRSRNGTLERKLTLRSEPPEYSSPNVRNNSASPPVDNTPDPEQSYFSTLSFIPPSPTPASNPFITSPTVTSFKPTPIQKPIPPIRSSILQERSIYLNENILKRTATYSLKNYFRPYFDELLSQESQTGRNRTVAEADEKLGFFLNEAERQAVQVVQAGLGLPRQGRGRLRDEGGWARVELSDLVVEVGLIELKQVRGDHYVCDDSLARTATNNLKNLQYLYDVIRVDPVLRQAFAIPMSCLVLYKGYSCFVSSRIDPNTDHDAEAGPNQHTVHSGFAFDRLASLSRVAFSIFQNEKAIQFLPRNSRKDKFVILHARIYLPLLQDCLSMRAQAFNSAFPQGSQGYIHNGNRRQTEGQTVAIRKQIDSSLSSLGQFMDKLQVYPIAPNQLSQLLHSNGLNAKHIGQLYSRISQHFLQGVLKAEAAARAFKCMFARKLQEEGWVRGREEQAALGLVNALLGEGEDSQNLWKVLSLHTQILFGLAVQPTDINRGYFLLALAYQLGLEMPRILPLERMFKTNKFVDQIALKARVEGPNLIPLWLKGLQDEWEVQPNSILFERATDLFRLKQKPLPQCILMHPLLANRFLSLAAYYVRPSDNIWSKLAVYESSSTLWKQLQNHNLPYYQRKLTELRWAIREQTNRERILVGFEQIRKGVGEWYGGAHPFLSQAWQLQSQFWVGGLLIQAGVRAGRESLSNMIQCCGNNHRHLKIANNHYQLCQLHRQAHQLEEAQAHLKKAKNLLEINNYQNHAEYALLLARLAQFALLHHKDNDAYELLLHAIRIYEQEHPSAHWQQLLPLYQTLPSCQIRAGVRAPRLDEQQLALHVEQQLQKVLSVELQFQICSDSQFIRTVRIIAQYVVALLPKPFRPILRDYLLEVSDANAEVPEDDGAHSQAILFFKALAADGKISSKLRENMEQTGQILPHLKQQLRMGRLMPYRRNARAQDYDKFMRHLLQLLGEPFLLNSIP